ERRNLGRGRLARPSRRWQIGSARFLRLAAGGEAFALREFTARALGLLPHQPLALANSQIVLRNPAIGARRPAGVAVFLISAGTAEPFRKRAVGGSGLLQAQFAELFRGAPLEGAAVLGAFGAIGLIGKPRAGGLRSQPFQFVAGALYGLGNRRHLAD